MSAQLTPREQIAAMILQGIMANPESNRSALPGRKPEEVRDIAIAGALNFADALLAVTRPEPDRERKPSDADMCKCGHPRIAHSTEAGCLATVSGTGFMCPCESFRVWKAGRK